MGGYNCPPSSLFVFKDLNYYCNYIVFVIIMKKLISLQEVLKMDKKVVARVNQIPRPYELPILLSLLSSDNVIFS